MMPLLFLKGILIGLGVSIPMGPVGILIVQRTVNKDRTSGVLSGMGASITDVIYAIIAGFSLNYVIDFIRLHEFAFQITGALVFFFLGIHIFVKNPARELRKYRKTGCNYLQDIASTFLITFPNPMVIFIFLTVFASSGIVFRTDEPLAVFAMILGIFAGATGWWLTLANVVSSFKHKVSLRVLWWFNKVSGITIMLFVAIVSIILMVNKMSL